MSAFVRWIAHEICFRPWKHYERVLAAGVIGLTGGLALDCCLGHCAAHQPRDGQAARQERIADQSPRTVFGAADLPRDGRLGARFASD